MRFPKILLAVALVVAGVAVPLTLPPLAAPPHGVIGMGHEGYEVYGIDRADDTGDMPVVTINVGQTLSFQNNSRWIHVIGPGDKGLLAPPGAGAMTPRKMLEQNETYTTPPWNTAGIYVITCTVHPEMNARVVVVP